LNEPSNAAIVFVIDGSDRLGRGLAQLLAGYEIAVESFTTTQAFLREADRLSTTAACLLLVLDGDCSAGFDQVSTLHARLPELPLIVLCDTPDEAQRDRFVALGADDAVSKSMVDAYIFTRLAQCLPDAACLPLTPASTMTLEDGTVVTFRMISPDDAAIEREFVNALSDRSRYLRFFSGLRELPEYLLRQLIDPHYPISYALIATVAADDECNSGAERQIGVARYAPTEDAEVAEFAVVVADEWQGKGIATQLLHGVMTAATVGGIARLEGLILRENTPMLRLARKLGFVVSEQDSDAAGAVKVVKALR